MTEDTEKFTIALLGRAIGRIAAGQSDPEAFLAEHLRLAHEDAEKVSTRIIRVSEGPGREARSEAREEARDHLTEAFDKAREYLAGGHGKALG